MKTIVLLALLGIYKPNVSAINLAKYEDKDEMTIGDDVVEVPRYEFVQKDGDKS